MATVRSNDVMLKHVADQYSTPSIIFMENLSWIFFWIHYYDLMTKWMT